MLSVSFPNAIWTHRGERGELEDCAFRVPPGRFPIVIAHIVAELRRRLLKERKRRRAGHAVDRAYSFRSERATKVRPVVVRDVETRARFSTERVSTASHVV